MQRGMRNRRVVLAVAAALVVNVARGALVAAADLKISSPAFTDKGKLPAKYSCDGEGVNPPLTFSNVPPRTASLALIVEDPDIPEQFKAQIPSGVFDHWVIWDIPATSKGFAEGAEKGGINAGGQSGFLPACPPDKAHRYFFKLFALDKKIGDTPIKSKQDLQTAMQGHIISQAEMVATYGPSRGK